MKLHTDKSLKSNPFEVPNGYFENMQAQIVSNVFPHKNKTIKLMPTILKYAASILILVSVGAWFFYQNTAQSNIDQWTEMVMNDIDSYETELLLSYADIGVESELFETDDFMLLKEDFPISDLYKSQE